MADEISGTDPQRRGTLVVKDSSSGEVIALVADGSTKRLLVDASITSGLSSQTGLQNGEAVDADDKGVLCLGSDGSNYRALAVDASGNLQVDIVSGSSANTEYTEGDTDATITGIAIMWEDTSNTLRAVSAAKPLPVEQQGAITETNSAAIKTAVEKIDDAISGSEMQVDIVSDGAGLATAANQSTIIGHVDGIEGLLTTIDADTSTLSGAISGSEMQVDIVGSLPAGTNTIGKLAANDGVDIGDVSINNTVTVNSELPSAVALSDTLSNPTAPAVGAYLVGYEPNNTQWERIKVTAQGILMVATDGSYPLDCSGNKAHDTVDSGNPLKIGFKAIAHGTNPAAVAVNDRTNWFANRHGIPWVIGGHPNIITLRANYTTAQTDAAIVTVAPGTKIVVTRCSVLVDNACSVDVQVRIGFATATTPTSTGVILSHPGIAAGSGVVEGSGSGILGIGADNEDLRITSQVPTGGSIDVVVSYYTIES